MIISKIQALNYKSFLNSAWIEFKPGINIVTGQNSSGRTALLEALTLVQPNNPHRSLKTVPTASSPLNPTSKIKFCLIFEDDEARTILPQIPKPYRMPILSDSSEMVPVLTLIQDWVKNPILDRLCFSIPPSDFDLEGDKSELSFGLYKTEPIFHGNCNQLIISENGEGSLVYAGTTSDLIYQTLAYKLFEKSRENIYRFYAECLNIGTCQRSFGFSPELAQNASNLPEVLGILQGDNPALFELLRQFKTEVQHLEVFS